MHVTRELPQQLVAQLGPEEEPGTGVAIVPDLAGVPELHVQLGPVTFRLLDHAALDAMYETLALARAAADATWRACQVCSIRDATVTTQGSLVAHLSCSYDTGDTLPQLRLVQ